jgi:hypothetical protein
MDEAQQALVRSWLLETSHDLAAARLFAAAEPAILDMAIDHCQSSRQR